MLEIIISFFVGFIAGIFFIFVFGKKITKEMIETLDKIGTEVEEVKSKLEKYDK